MNRRLAGLLPFVLFLFLTASEAQITTATIAGTVTDQTGAIMAGATVTAKNTATGISRSTVSTTSGRYEFTNLAVGTYEVSATMTGFQTILRSGIELTVGRHAIVDLLMQVGAVTETVSVKGEAPLVETTSASVANLVDEKRVEDLPLHNRDLTGLVLLQPGILATTGAGRGSGQKISAAGAREVKSMYMLDGVSNSDYTGEAAGTSGTYLGAETVKEFQVISNNYSAALQSTSGAVISAITKSGTNTFHGSAFWDYRGDRLDAYSWESKRVPGATPTKGAYSRHMFGGSVGGPIVHDRTFFFASYEAMRDRSHNQAIANLPTAAARAGIFPGVTAPVSIDPVVKPYISLWPLPGSENQYGVPLVLLKDNLDGTVQVAGTNSVPTDDHLVAGKIDHQFSTGKAGSLSGSFSFSNSRRDNQGLVSLVNTYSDSAKRTISIKHTSILSPVTLNEFTFGYTYTDPTGNNLILPKDLDMTPYLFRSDRPAFGPMVINNVSDLGATDNNPTLWKLPTYTYKDDLKLMRGAHTISIGTQILPWSSSFTEGGNGYYGSYQFSGGWQSFLQNTPSLLETPLPGADAGSKNIKSLTVGMYAEDSWQARRGLTIDLGLRYEFATVPQERDGRSSVLLHFMDDHATVGPFWKNPTLKSFAPRLGIAWAPGTGHTSIRAGFGVFYDLPGVDEIRSSSEMPPFKLVGQITPQQAQQAGQAKIIFPNALAQLPLLQATPQIRGLEYNLKDSTTYRWSFALQHEISQQWMVSAEYTGSRGVHLFMQSGANLYRWDGWPNNPDAAKTWPAITGTNFINPAFGDVRMQSSQGESTYHGLGLSVKNRIYHGLVMQVAYTFSKSIDLDSSSTSDRMSFYWGDLRRQARGVSQLDQKHNLVANFSYDVPFGQQFTGFLGVLAKGWQLSPIISIGSGPARTPDFQSTAQSKQMGARDQLPVDLIPGGNNNPTSGTSAGCVDSLGNVRAVSGEKLGTPDRWFDPCQFVPAPASRFGNLGRGTLIMPGLATVDLSLHKDFRITENHRLQFRADCFNLLNHSNFNPPAYNTNALWSSSGVRNVNAGTITSTKGPRTAQLGLRYTF